MKRILILHMHGIGDWLFFTPVIAGIRKTYPGAIVEVATGLPGTARFISQYKDVKIISTVNIREGLLPAAITIARTARERYDCLMITAGMRYLKQELFTAVQRRTKVRVGLLPAGRRTTSLTHWAEYGNGVHKVEDNWKLARLIGITDDSFGDPWYPTSSAELTASGLLIHPGCDAANSFRRWPAEYFIQIAVMAVQKGGRVGILFGPDEISLLPAFRSALGESVEYIVPSSIEQLAPAIETYKVFLNSDSGPGHIAAALGLRVFSIFGPADYVYTRPFSKHATVLRLPEHQQPMCMPCVRPGGLYGCGERPCLINLAPQAVWEQLSEALD